MSPITRSKTSNVTKPNIIKSNAKVEKTKRVSPPSKARQVSKTSGPLKQECPCLARMKKDFEEITKGVVNICNYYRELVKDKTGTRKEEAMRVHKILLQLAGRLAAPPK